MRKIKLTRYEQKIEDEIDQYVPGSKEEFDRIKKILDARKKNAVLNIRINKGALDNLKLKAAKMGVRYQTFISEILYKVATT